MNRTKILALIKTHNENVAQFKTFCNVLDEVNDGGFPTDKWFKLFQVVPRFSNHAAILVKEAREAGINAKYDAQGGGITIYESDGKKYCEHCSEVDLIVGFSLEDKENLDIRFDPVNAEIDVIYLGQNIDHSISINYCPFCGIKLRETEVSK